MPSPKKKKRSKLSKVAGTLVDGEESAPKMTSLVGKGSSPQKVTSTKARSHESSDRSNVEGCGDSAGLGTAAPQKKGTNKAPVRTGSVTMETVPNSSAVPLTDSE